MVVRPFGPFPGPAAHSHLLDLHLNERSRSLRKEYGHGGEGEFADRERDKQEGKRRRIHRSACISNVSKSLLFSFFAMSLMEIGLLISSVSERVVLHKVVRNSASFFPPCLAAAHPSSPLPSLLLSRNDFQRCATAASLRSSGAAPSSLFPASAPQTQACRAGAQSGL